ncbi:MAG: hypothetical protein BWY75_02906 [bacterium ADurb.Bin425]|nr:MAG: hypothetical protein BWY75_02906 [bacterium ADurb.Bin425]
MQEAHLVFAEIDESSINTRQNILYCGGIDITEQEFASIDEKLDNPVILEQGSNIVLL